MVLLSPHCCLSCLSPPARGSEEPKQVCCDETLSSLCDSLAVDVAAFQLSFLIHQIGFPEAKPAVSAFFMKLGSVL